MIKGKKVVFYELNEVPRRVLEAFVDRYPRSNFARLLREGRFFETRTEDQGILSPWITWPTLHRGVANDKHCISDFGQDLSEVNAEYPSFMDLLARKGIRVGVFGSLHTYPLPENVEKRYAFYVPDTFANGPECFPETLSAFQAFNLKMVDSSARNVSRSLMLKDAAGFLLRAPGLGLRADTSARLAGQLVSERLNRARSGRRRTSQTQIAFDFFYRQLTLHKPDLATFFTNHVASSMHRYWPAKFPDDSKDVHLDSAWHATYADEIDFTMREADRQIARLTSFVEKNSGYALIVTTSMGQAAVDTSTIVHHQLYITDLQKFMRQMGVREGGWVKHRAMLPRYIFKVAEAEVADFRKALRTLTVNGKPVPSSDLGGNIFQIKLGQENLVDDDTVVLLDGRVRTLDELGLANVAIQDETGSYAYHIPQGIMLVYDPRQPSSRAPASDTISTLDIAPALLANFDVARPGYMQRGLT